MVQKTFYFNNQNELETLLRDIKGETIYKSASGILMQLYNPRIDIDEDLMVKTINKACPEACLTGLTSANLAGNALDISQYPVLLSISFFKDTKLYQYEFDMDTTTAFVAGRVMNEALDGIENLKCMQIFYATTSIAVDNFMFEFNHHSVAKFGAKAGRSVDKNNTAHVYGKKVYTNAFVVVAFASKSLRIYMDNNLGWQPIGVEMVATETHGDYILSKIDGRPATDIYSKYLKVKPDKYFFENVCEFPIIIERDCLKIARVPASYREDGSIVFTSGIKKGDRFKLSFGDKDVLCSLSKQSASDLSTFNPQAVYVFECGNRMRFLMHDFLKELALFSDIYPNLSSVTGYAEIFITPEGKGADLNSSLVTIGLTEDSDADDRIIECRTFEPTEEDSSYDENKPIPFVERILAFLESTSQELDKLNHELENIAFTDQLTKIYNRWELERKLEEHIDFQDQEKPFGLLFIDIDHFKNVNDTYGHDIGDNVLLAVVNLIREKLKPGHVFGRWGGEEFIYLAPADNENELFEFAESIRKTVDEVCFLTVKHLTISIGATMARPEDTLESLVKRADDNLYTAKETGRNKVVLK
ncbi:MAG: GGDEF domain-containing protein [Pseudobutyrivibrio sp.]|nr:GGDEF domain-containing protein [Pseudobutyrivibrio sp.]